MTLNRTQHPAFNKIEHINFPKVEKITLDNNVPLYILNGGSQPILKLDVMVNAGSIYSTKKLIAPATGLMLHEGSKNKTGHEIAEIFDFYGAYFQPSVEKDVAFCGLVTLNKHLDKTLPLFNEVLNHSTFPENEVSILLERRRQNFLVDMEKTAFVARELFNQQIFGVQHPYGILTREDDYTTTSRNELFNFYQTHYNSGNYTLVLSGMVTENDIKLINDLMGKTPAIKALPIPEINPTPIVNSEPIVSIKDDAVQSSIRMGLLTVNKFHDDYLGLKILTTIFGGYFGSRLMKNIREEKGYTYGINSMLVSFQNCGYIGIAADVKAQNAREAIDEIKKEMEKLRTTKVSQDELNLVQNYMMGDMLQMFDGPMATSDTFKAMLQYNMGFEYFEQMKQTILTIAPEKLQELANKYFNFDKLITVVVGKFD
jgi:predicted Zn-dependent peptidase